MAFLQWALPRMGMRWKGFRKVRRQVCRRIRDRIRELDLDGTLGYREYLSRHPDEWDHLAFLCRVTISRFQRDREVFATLGERILPALAGRHGRVRVWSAGCASGEEPYTLVVLWRTEVLPKVPDARLQILATDIDPHLLERARIARYPRSALRELGDERIARAFRPTDVEDEFTLRAEFREGVRFRRADVRQEMPPGRFELVLSRNLVFTYFEEGVQRTLLRRLLYRLGGGGWLAIGSNEDLPEGRWPLERPWKGLPLYRVRAR